MAVTESENSQSYDFVTDAERRSFIITLDWIVNEANAMNSRRMIIALVLIVVFIAAYLLFWVRFPPPHGPNLEKRVEMNLRYLVTTAFEYMATEDVNSVTYQDLLDNEFYMEDVPKSYLGEDYSGFKLTDKDTSVEVRTEDGKTISFSFDEL